MTLELGVESAICIWDWDHLPDCVKEHMIATHISTSDLDWIALLPKIYEDHFLPWLECPSFGCCRVDSYPIGKLGYTLVVGYHS